MDLYVEFKDWRKSCGPRWTAGLEVDSAGDSGPGNGF